MVIKKIKATLNGLVLACKPVTTTGLCVRLRTTHSLQATFWPGFKFLFESKCWSLIQQLLGYIQICSTISRVAVFFNECNIKKKKKVAKFLHSFLKHKLSIHNPRYYSWGREQALLLLSLKPTVPHNAFPQLIFSIIMFSFSTDMNSRSNSAEKCR